MSNQALGKAGLTNVSHVTLGVAVLAGVIVPPSSPKPGLSELERTLSDSVVPLLILAFGAALCALMASRATLNRAERLLATLSLAIINVAGYFGGRCGLEGAGLLMTLLGTSPVLWMIIQREFASRRVNGHGPP